MTLFDKLTDRRLEKCDMMGIAFKPMPAMWATVEDELSDWITLLACKISSEKLKSGHAVVLPGDLPVSGEGRKTMSLSLLTSLLSSWASGGGGWVSRSSTHLFTLENGDDSIEKATHWFWGHRPEIPA
jgi:hypothetical protein